MRILLILLSVIGLLSARGHTALRNQVTSLIGKELSGSIAIIANINKVDKNGCSALHHAVALGDLPLVEFFLANGANTGIKDNEGLIPLRYAERIAAEQPTVERMQIVSLVLEETRGLNRGDERGWPPMVWSLMAGDYERVIELRDRGADIFAGRFTNGRRQLAGRHNAVWAAEHLQDDRAIKILAEGAPEKYFPAAVGNGYRKFVQAMIDQGVNVNARDIFGYRATMRAAKAGRLNDLQMLIDNGAEIDSAVLFLAIYSGNPKLVETILNHNVELASELMISIMIKGKSSLNDATPYLEESIADVLIGSNASKGKRRIRQMMSKAIAEVTPSLPFVIIAELHHLREIKNLKGSIFENASEVNRELRETLRQDDQLIRDISEHMPAKLLPIVVDNGYQKIAQAMVARGIDVNARDFRGYNAAMRAVKADRLDDLQMLIANGAKLDSMLLFLALHSGNPKLVEAILDHDVSVVNKLVVDVVSGRISDKGVYDLLERISANNEGERIIKMLKQAGYPLSLLSQLSRLKKEHYGNLSLLEVATSQGLKLEMRQLLDYLVGTKDFMPVINRVLRHMVFSGLPKHKGSEMLLNSVAGIMTSRQLDTEDQPQLLYTLQGAILVENIEAIETLLDQLGGSVAYPELLRGLAIANDAGNTDLAELLLEKAVIAGIDKDKLTRHARLIEGLGGYDLKRQKDPVGVAFLHAIENEDAKAVREFIDYGVEINAQLRYSIVRQATAGSVDFFEFLVDHQVISLNHYSSLITARFYNQTILGQAAQHKNLPIIDKVISLGGKVGITSALIQVVSEVYVVPPQTKTEIAESEKKLLAIMKSLIKGGADVNDLSKYGLSPLTEAIVSLQVPRVKLLLEHGATAGDLNEALRKAKFTITKYSPTMELEYKKNLSEIKKMLADKGVL